MIAKKYLLVINIPTYRDASGRRLVEELWHKDLLKHLDHIDDLTLASPSRAEPPPDGAFFPVERGPGQGTISYLDLPPCRSTLSALMTLPSTIARLWGGIGRAEVVHAGVGGWPISLGWFAAPIARLRGKFLLINIEGAQWRMGFRRPLRPKPLLQALVFEVLGRFCVNLADLATFTHAGYRDGMMLKSFRHRGHVLCASWIDQDLILPVEHAKALWMEKLREPSRPLRVVYAGHLTRFKGLDVLLRALDILDERGVPLEVRVYGKGDLQTDCEAAARRLGRGGVQLELRGMVAYGPDFFEMLRGHDLLVAPIVSDEQPRIVFDAFSQAVPVIASDTPGLRECVSEGRNGWLVPVGDPRALADAMETASKRRDVLRDFGIHAIGDANALTHDQMHARRAALIEQALDSGTAFSGPNPGSCDVPARPIS